MQFSEKNHQFDRSFSHYLPTKVIQVKFKFLLFLAAIMHVRSHRPLRQFNALKKRSQTGEQWASSHRSGRRPTLNWLSPSWKNTWPQIDKQWLYEQSATLIWKGLKIIYQSDSAQRKDFVLTSKPYHIHFHEYCRFCKNFFYITRGCNPKNFKKQLLSFNVKQTKSCFTTCLFFNQVSKKLSAI